jgi:hypothetical protein
MPQNCSQTVQEESLDGMVIVLEKESSRTSEYSGDLIILPKRGSG